MQTFPSDPLGLVDLAHAAAVTSPARKPGAPDDRPERERYDRTPMDAEAEAASERWWDGFYEYELPDA